jgi:hypothetical protein
MTAEFRVVAFTTPETEAITSWPPLLIELSP